MECANCFIPNREVPDMDKDLLYDVLRRLPFKTEIRMLGGEPTVRKDIFEIVEKIFSFENLLRDFSIKTCTLRALTLIINVCRF
jgi:molybdenum cofactor biosynthesis enzyme MoaA